MPLSIRGTSNPNSTETLGQEASNQPDAGAPRRGPHRQGPAPDVDACPVRSELYGTPAAGFFHPPPPRPNSKAGTTHSIHPDAITFPECCTPLAWGPLTWPVLSLFRSGDGTSPDGGFPRRVLQRAASPREADTVSSNIFNCPVKLTIIEPIIEETIPDTLPELSIN